MFLRTVDAGRAAFLNYCRRERNLSGHTLNAYEQDITCFARFLEANADIDDLDGATVLAYLEHLRRVRGHREATIRRRMLTLRSFSTWSRRNGTPGTDPFDGLELDLKLPKRLPRPVDRIDVRKLLAHRDECIDLPDHRDRAAPSAKAARSSVTSLAIKLMVATGVRVGELTRVKLTHISNDGYRIRIHGKGSRERNVYIGNRELRAELQHMKWRAATDPHDGDYLLLNRSGRRLSEAALRRRLRSLEADCSLDTRITPHRFRHSAATFLIEEGVDIRFVQRLLGHSSIATTEIYTRVSDTALMHAVEMADPLGKLLCEFT